MSGRLWALVMISLVSEVRETLSAPIVCVCTLFFSRSWYYGVGLPWEVSYEGICQSRSMSKDLTYGCTRPKA